MILNFAASVFPSTEGRLLRPQQAAKRRLGPTTLEKQSP